MKIKSASGFSLIELLIVMAIAGTLLSIAVPTYYRFRDNSNLREAAGEVSGDIQLYKQSAVAENIRYRIQFSIANNQYTVQRETTSGWVDVIKDKKVGAAYNDVIKIIGDPTFASDTITFQLRGTCNAGTLEIQHSKRQSKAIIIVSMMGRVRVTYEL